LEKVCDTVSYYDIKTILGDINTKVGKESYSYPVCERHSLHNETNDNGK
jgi:hypothetical protein